MGLELSFFNARVYAPRVLDTLHMFCVFGEFFASRLLQILLRLVLSHLPIFLRLQFHLSNLCQIRYMIIQSTSCKATVSVLVVIRRIHWRLVHRHALPALIALSK